MKKQKNYLRFFQLRLCRQIIIFFLANVTLDVWSLFGHNFIFARIIDHFIGFNHFEWNFECATVMPIPITLNSSSTIHKLMCQNRIHYKICQIAQSTVISCAVYDTCMFVCSSMFSQFLALYTLLSTSHHWYNPYDDWRFCVTATDCELSFALLYFSVELFLICFF